MRIFLNSEQIIFTLLDTSCYILSIKYHQINDKINFHGGIHTQFRSKAKATMNCS